jgi:hypothetical protein
VVARRIPCTRLASTIGGSEQIFGSLAILVPLSRLVNQPLLLFYLFSRLRGEVLEYLAGYDKRESVTGTGNHLEPAVGQPAR